MTENKRWQQHTQALTTVLNQTPFGVITDIDGTISPIAPTPEEAEVTATARDSLRALVKKVRLVAVITGRGAADAHRMLNIPNVEIMGSHGLERWRDGEAVISEEGKPYLEAIRGALEEADPLMVRFGMTPEPKGITASLHYRNAPNRDSVRDAVYSQLATIAARHDLELFEGRYIFELHPPLEVNKGTALVNLVEEYKLNGVVFLGDDITDVNAMRGLKTLRETSRLDGACLAVVSDESPEEVATEADYILNGVPDVEKFLQWLLDNVG